MVASGFLSIAIHGRVHTVRIDAVAQDRMDRNLSGSPADIVWLHSFAMQLRDGSWQSVRSPGPDGRAAGFPLADQTGAAWRLHPAEPGIFDIACTDGGQGNCVRFGYHPRRTADRGVALLP